MAMNQGRSQGKRTHYWHLLFWGLTNVGRPVRHLSAQRWLVSGRYPSHARSFKFCRDDSLQFGLAWILKFSILRFKILQFLESRRDLKHLYCADTLLNFIQLQQFSHLLQLYDSLAMAVSKYIQMRKRHSCFSATIKMLVTLDSNLD